MDLNRLQWELRTIAHCCILDYGIWYFMSSWLTSEPLWIKDEANVDVLKMHNGTQNSEMQKTQLKTKHIIQIRKIQNSIVKGWTKHSQNTELMAQTRTRHGTIDLISIILSFYSINTSNSFVWIAKKNGLEITISIRSSWAEPEDDVRIIIAVSKI